MTPNSSRIWRPASFVLPPLHLTKKCVEPPDGVGGALTFNETLPCHRYHLIRSRSLNTPVRSSYLPKHGALFGVTGAGKPFVVADLLAQIGTVSIQVHRRRRTVACCSHADARLSAR